MAARKVLVAGGAGFLGSHLCAALLARGDEVVCVDNLCTGRRKNIAALEADPHFTFVEHDITEPLPKTVTGQKYDVVANLACPASPPQYTRLAVETLLVGATGTKQLLDLAARDHARYVHTSTSEVYGDPAVHPQPEKYWGNVNSYGARSMYDESKRFSEAMIWVYRHQKQANTGVVRIFNTYGPHMDPEDGRVVSNFIIQALQNQPITMYGKGTQTRSFCYVGDQIAGLIKMLDGDVEGPVNIGNPDEFTMAQLAEQVLKLTGSKSAIEYKPLPPDDPGKRRPDITRAKGLLGWKPKVSLADGLPPTIEYFKRELGQ
ncbi:MAG TPA: UDP-glucuronic acid decarboxylase family protein [Candidatus Saccharimonadales bacterium]|nr:UDP-glucuronic acid decarboxylase family protein [Candidatus Saccharimonadales bacterium]